MKELLEIKNISKEFSGKKVVDNVSFEVNEGEILGVLGPNGAGKTTIIRCIMNIIHPDNGSIEFHIDEKNDLITSEIGYLPEERGLYKTVKVMDILLYLSGLKNYPKEKAKKRIYEYLEKFDLVGKEKVKVEELSKGMAQKVQFIASVLHEPKLLILDEPFSGLDPVSQDVFKNEIKKLAADGTAILLSAHQMNLVEAVCNRIFLINKGKKVIYGEMNRIKESFADFKCIIKGENRHVRFNDMPPVERVEYDDGTTTIFLKKDVDPQSFLSGLPQDLDIKEMFIDRISLHDIFVGIATGGNAYEK